jgi:hypothetical protein
MAVSFIGGGNQRKSLTYRKSSHNVVVYSSMNGWLMVFNATFNNISAKWWSVLLVEETVVPGENQRPVASH